MNHAARARAIPPNAAPTPMPIFAPVDSDSGLLSAAAAVEVEEGAEDVAVPVVVEPVVVEIVERADDWVGVVEVVRVELVVLVVLVVLVEVVLVTVDEVTAVAALAAAKKAF